MVKKPNFSRYASLKTENNFQNSIINGGFKSQVMLVMMVPGADISFRPNSQQKPSHYEPWILNSEINNKVESKIKGNNRDWKLISFLTKY
jgi:hypothetical protein